MGLPTSGEHYCVPSSAHHGWPTTKRDRGYPDGGGAMGRPSAVLLPFAAVIDTRAPFLPPQSRASILIGSCCPWASVHAAAQQADLGSRLSTGCGLQEAVHVQYSATLSPCWKRVAQSSSASYPHSRATPRYRGTHPARQMCDVRLSAPAQRRRCRPLGLGAGVCQPCRS